MKRFLAVVAVVLAILVGTSTREMARGCGYGMPSPLARFALADSVIYGEVVLYEEATVEALPVPKAKAKAEYRVAVIKVLEAPKSSADITYLRMGLLQHQIIPLGYKGCFFLMDHHQEAFFVMQTVYDYSIGMENNPGFGKQMEQYQLWGRLMKDPVAGMRSKDATERLTTAALLVNRYRPTDWDGVPGVKTEPINATESKLILETLAEADWTKAGIDFRVTPRRLFNQLAPKDKDGWTPKPWKDTQEADAAAKAWLKDNASRFRITTWVSN